MKGKKLIKYKNNFSISKKKFPIQFKFKYSLFLCHIKYYFKYLWNLNFSFKYNKRKKECIFCCLKQKQIWEDALLWFFKPQIWGYHDLHCTLCKSLGFGQALTASNFHHLCHVQHLPTILQSPGFNIDIFLLHSVRYE